MVTRMIVALFVVGVWSVASQAQKWPKGEAQVIANADPYVAIPGAALSPTPLSSYNAVFDATRMAKEPSALVPALNAAGGLLNDLAVGGTPINHTHFVVVFHGAATDGILDNVHYRAKYGVDNPNLSAIAKMKARGVRFYVCGQHLAANEIDPSTLSKDVTVAADAFLVLISFQNKGYGVMFF